MADSHQFLEPHPLAMERLPLHDLVLPIKTGTTQEFLDYRKVPRSRGDGMEFSSSDSPEFSPRKSSGELASSVPHQLHNQMSQINNINGSVKLRGFLTHDRIDGQGNYDKSKEIKKLSTTSSTEKSVVYNESEGKTSLTKNISELSPTIQDAKLTSSLQPSKAEVPAALHSPFSTRPAQVHNTPLDLSVQVTNQEMTQSTEDSQEEVGSVFKTTVVERGAEFMETHSIIRELEERNSKLVEEKTKLVVQLGVQAKVNAEIKQLLVASVGEDLENRLEALVQQSAQQTVAIEHWKKMSEEYAEESDRLEIECDVWRTKFLASRMLSDELSSWKATLYARHRQAQQALEKILEERAELQQYLRNTRRSLQSLGYTLKYSSNSSTEGILKCKTDSFEQSILEMASINDCLAQEALELSQQVLPSPSLSATALMLTQSMDSKPHQAVEHTPAERLAIQVLTNNVDLQTEEKQDTSCIMKRMGRQYIGHGHRSRLSTNSFRVTFDCCDRCTGPVIVV